MKVTVTTPGSTPNPNPNPNPDPNPDKFVVYFDNSDGWSQGAPSIWAWTASEENLTGGTWPGQKMTLVEGSLYKWENAQTPYGIIFTNHAGAKAGGAGTGSGEGDILNPKSGSIYNSQNTVVGTVDPDPVPDPVPDPEYSRWILGNFAGSAGWGSTPGTGVGMFSNGPVYQAENVEFVAAAGETKCYFNLTDYVGATWDDLNEKANRWGAPEEGTEVTLGQTMPMTLYANNVSASGCLSWTIAPGTYDITADFNNLKLTVKRANSTSVEEITSDVAVSPVYYTLQGIKVENPTNGLYIVVRGSKVTKEYVR